jgi:cysteinyl-tRNA synthetase
MAASTARPPALRLRLGGTDLSVVGRTRLYVCGVTPYDVTHLGHAATYVWVDAVDRVLRKLGGQVEVCRNVTDVDDVLFAAAERAGGHYDQFAAVQQFHFEQDMEALSVRKPTHEPRAHVFIPQVIALAQTLLDRGRAYEAGGSVYLPGSAVVEAAGLDRDAAELLLKEYAGRLDDPAKRDPVDQAVWQRSEADEPAWDSPWGPGRPGWHAECTAMALSTYGAAMDLHAGGADLRFPHHAFEAAQAEAATGVVPFARAWMHVGLVQLEGQKMAKSVGNLVFAKDLLAQASPGAVRTMLLDRRYDASWDYEPRLLASAQQRSDALYRAAGTAGSSDAAWQQVLAALADDLDVPRALDIAIEEGGQVARDLTTVLAL